MLPSSRSSRSALFLAAGGLLYALRVLAAPSAEPPAWGSDHVGQPVPDYVTGDECLFCHRADVGPSWPKNRHQRSFVEADASMAALAALGKSPALAKYASEVKYLLGGQRQLRYLKASKAYGQLELLSVGWAPAPGNAAGELRAVDHPHWDAHRFQDGCAGCHATGVDSKMRSFSAAGLDCYVCHGDVNLQHSKDTALVHLAKKRQDPARVVTSICAQCHVRTGQARSTGLPYPNNFVAGDNLFRDFRVDLSDAALAALNPADRHIQENVRAVVERGQDSVTCLSCHEVHASSTRKHHRLPNEHLCLSCHAATGSKKERKAYEVHSVTCGY